MCYSCVVCHAGSHGGMYGCITKKRKFGKKKYELFCLVPLYVRTINIHVTYAPLSEKKASLKNNFLGKGHHHYDADSKVTNCFLSSYLPFARQHITELRVCYFQAEAASNGILVRQLT